MAINANQEIKRVKKLQNRVADKITAFAGTMAFVYFHVVWFTLWVLLNVGVFGAFWKFDDFPFGFLTMTVSLEAIFLSTFVLISQNRQGQIAEMRSELDYKTDVKAEKEIDVIMKTLERLAKHEGIDTRDLSAELRQLRQQDNPKKQPHTNK